MIAVYQSEELLHATISGECDFAAAQELLFTCKARLHEDRITHIEIMLKDVTCFDSSAVGAMLLLSDCVSGNLHVYNGNRRQSLFSSFSSYLHQIETAV